MENEDYEEFDEIEENKENEKKADSFDDRTRAYFAISRATDTLKALIDTAESMMNGWLPVMPETKKTVQNSVKELCTAIYEAVSKYVDLMP